MCQNRGCVACYPREQREFALVKLRPGHDCYCATPNACLSKNSCLHPQGWPTPKDTMQAPDSNPKTRHGITKVPMQLIPGSALAIEATAFRDGSNKYGPYNWRDEPVSASIYIAAALRHIQQWYNGEELADDSGVHHLGHARACLAILIDAQFAGSLNDDRPAPMDLSALYKDLTVEAPGA